MRIFRHFTLAAVFGVTAGIAVQAQTLNRPDGPKELPPASYTATQYVDSTGCVFLRAGIDGVVTWVPRVTRDRKLVCGFQPTFGTPAASASPGVQRPAPVEITAAVQSQPAATPRRVVRRAAPVAPRRPVTVVRQTPRGGELIVVTVENAASAGVSPDARVVPKHVYLNRHHTGVSTVPAGYAPVWEDGRLNPRRAEQSLRGVANTRLVWTNTVPRKLVRVPEKVARADRSAVVYSPKAASTPTVTYATRSASGVTALAPIRSGAAKAPEGR